MTCRSSRERSRLKSRLPSRGRSMSPCSEAPGPPMSRRSARRGNRPFPGTATFSRSKTRWTEPLTPIRWMRRRDSLPSRPGPTARRRSPSAAAGRSGSAGNRSAGSSGRRSSPAAVCCSLTTGRRRRRFSRCRSSCRSPAARSVSSSLRNRAGRLRSTRRNSPAC